MAATIQEYLAGLRGKTVAVIGIGVSNTPLIKMLLRSGIRVTACDKKRREEFGGLAEELESLGAELRLGPDYLRGLDQDVIFRTPGLRPDVSELLLAQAKGSVVTSEMEVFFQVCPCHTIAVTGSDGKTTTTTIIAELLKKAGYHTFVGGNIGKPLLPDVDGMVPEDYAVLELSSFQLMTMDQSPEIAVVTNLAPNHLDVHKSMAEYIAAKENIFTHQGPEGKAVFNYDNAITREFSESAPGQAVLFSRRQELTQGVYVKDGAIWVSNREGSRAVLPLADILLPGEHNVENYMAAIAAVDGLVPDEVIRAFAAQFAGVEHRIEFVRELDGVKWYNDSIASNPTRTIAGLMSFNQKLCIIAGGYDKKIPFQPLADPVAERVKLLILTGPTADKIEAAVKASPKYDPAQCRILRAKDLPEAVALARQETVPGDIVSLSPACASFDAYPNFEVRGQHFKELVRALS